MDPEMQDHEESNVLPLKRTSELETEMEAKRVCVDDEDFDNNGFDDKNVKRSSRRLHKSVNDELEGQEAKRKSHRNNESEFTVEMSQNIGENNNADDVINCHTDTENLETGQNEQVDIHVPTSNMSNDNEVSENTIQEINSEENMAHESVKETELQMTAYMAFQSGFDERMAPQPDQLVPDADGGNLDTDEVVEVIVPAGKEKPEMIVLDDITNDDDAPGPDEVPTAEERGFWKAVEENPNDFASWTYLLQVVEKNGKLKQIQKAFASFLQLYPYCYGYWKKYADQMRRLVDNEAAYEVYNEAVVAIPLSVDLWTYFIHFIAEWKNGDENEIRMIYQRAVAACGQEFRSDKIWEAFVEWEKQTDNYRVLGLYKEFLGCVIQRHQHHFDKFREWIFFTPVKDIVTMESIKELLAKHKAESLRIRMENEKKAKKEAERARLAEEAARQAAEQQRLEAEDEERRLQEEIQRMQDDYKAATGHMDLQTDNMQDEMEAEKVPMESEQELPNETAVDVSNEEASSKEGAHLLHDDVEMSRDTSEGGDDDERKDVEKECVVGDDERKEDGKESLDCAVIVDETCVEETPTVDVEEPLPDSPDALTAKQEAAVREQILLDVAPIHEQVLLEIQEVTPYEEGIKRPYFHVKELERVQLKNWKNYLNLIIEKNDSNRTIILFERCLIACAFYEGFWIKYINFMKNIDVEETRRIYRRACMVHLVKKPQIHLNWAAFEEQHGHLEVAREALDHIDKGMPGLIAVTLRRAGLERRTGNIEQGGDILKTVIENCRGRETRDFWALKYVSYLQFIMKDIQAAKKFLNEQIERNTRNKRLYVRLLDLELSPTTDTPDSEAVLKVLEDALSSSLPLEDKAGFSHRRLTFLEEFGNDIAAINSSYDDHNKNYKAVIDEKKKDLSSQGRDFRRRDTTNYSSTRNYNSRDRSYNSKDRSYNQNNSYNTTQNSYTSTGYNNMGNYNMQQAAQQQHYQQWYSQYAAQQQPYSTQTQYQQSRGY